MIHPEIESEQAYLDHAHERLDAMREAARSLAAEVLSEGAGGTHANRVERDIRVELSGRRLAQLNIGDASVCFGRLDYSSGLRAYIGRIGVSDEDGDQLVVDWRAPVAEPFYRATPTEPLGVARRRHFMFRGRTIVGIDDELLDRSSPHDLVLLGEGALLAGLALARTGRMHDIVATIQAEQDAVIRSDLAGILVVQGGPGTGKTAVALHRAAYLLFTHRQRLERDGVLLVGPNSVFLRYIEQVLPSLGEHTVAMATPGELYAGATRPRATEPPEVSELKGDARMVRLLANAVATRERALRHPLVISRGRHQLTISVAETRRIVEEARARRGTHNEKRGLVERLFARAVVRLWRQAEERSVRAGLRRAVDKAEQTRVAAGMASELRQNRDARAALERMWPVLTPEQLLHDLYGAEPLLRAAGRGVLEPPEIALLARPRATLLGEVAWTESDIALLDEAAQLLGSARPRPRRAETGGGVDAWMLDRMAEEDTPECPACGALLELGSGERPWHCERCGRRFREDQVGSPYDAAGYADLRSRLNGLVGNGNGPIVEKSARVYGHVVVDEAQQMTAMQWRSLARRCPAGSFTVVGDLGQASAAAAPASWHEALSELPSRSRVRVAELTVNYRTPAEVMELAAAVLAEAAPGLVPPRSVRESNEPPEFRQVTAELLLAEAEAASRAERERLGAGEAGRVAVVAPRSMLDALALALRAPLYDGRAALSAAEARSVLDSPLAVFATDAVRGLEFDSVVLVDPAGLVGEHPHGLRALYVAITRTTRRLVVVHADELPAALSAAVSLTA